MGRFPARGHAVGHGPWLKYAVGAWSIAATVATLAAVARAMKCSRSGGPSTGTEWATCRQGENGGSSPMGRVGSEAEKNGGTVAFDRWRRCPGARRWLL
jgi:hypothetical protein